MKKRAWILVTIATLGMAIAVTAEDPLATLSGKELWQQANRLFFPLPEEVPNPENQVTAAKVELGKHLYYDKRLSRKGTVSCDSCHILAEFGVDNRPLSPGDDAEFGDRNSPTVYNAALHVLQFWDGRAKDVEEQAGMPILNPVEMAIPDEQFLVDRLAAVESYQAMFADAFPSDEPSLTYRNIARALGAFERTLLTPSRFDEYLKGNLNALSEMEREGLRTFIELGCASCHSGYAIGGYGFRKFGIREDYWEHTKSETVDEGRIVETGRNSDRFVFKVAALRNVAETAPYFHDGSVEDLGEAIEIMTRVQIGIELTDQQTSSLVAFLESLTGEIPASVLEIPTGVIIEPGALEESS